MAGEEISTGNVRSAGETLRDVGISAVSGFITGAIGAKFPGMNHLVEGVVDTTVSADERLAYAVFDDSMSWDEKWAYAFDPGQMVADFVTGVVIGEILDGIMAATQNKLRSIFANYDATMHEALESGSNTVNPKDVNFMQSSIKNQTGEHTVLGNAEALKSGALKATDLPEIRIWQDADGKLWTLDHRRLAAFRMAELDSVPFRWATDEEVANQMWKMTTKTNGISIKLKLADGQSMTIQ